MGEKPTTKLCKHCKTEIPYGAKVCPNCRKKQGGALKWVIIAVVAILIIGAMSGGNDTNTETANSNVNSETQTVNKSEASQAQTNNNTAAESQTETKEETKDKYYAGDTWQNKYIKVTYNKCYEFTDYTKYNAPSDGNKIICAEFEFENIGSSDETVMYTDFHGYADGYEVNQSYAPDGTGLDFSVKMSSGRKGTGIVAFEVPENAEEIEIEFSPNFWTSENIIFVYQ
jgi:uncharacterized protein YxeA